jgi:hypothetical protein
MIPTRALVELGHAEPPDPEAPGMFALADRERLRDLMEAAGLVEVVIESIELNRDERGIDAYLEETLDLSRPFADVRDRLPAQQWTEVVGRVSALAEPFTAADGAVHFPARSLAAAAGA